MNIGKVLDINNKTDISYINKYLNEKYETEDEKKYILYQIYGDVLEGIELDVIKNRIKTDEYSWNHKTFKHIKNIIEEQDDFTVNPFELEEGVLECNKCGSKKVYSYSKQIRSGDEGFTTFANCISCKAKWQYKG
jgi:DNA-directed RNA polymerase subunit M/transcription elongation factor TFIIS